MKDRQTESDAAWLLLQAQAAARRTAAPIFAVLDAAIEAGDTGLIIDIRQRLEGLRAVVVDNSTGKGNSK